MSLQLDMNNLKGEIGDYLGWGRGEAEGEEAWDADKDRQLTRLLNTALRWVYLEATLDPKMPPHRWTFLTPSANFTVTSGNRTVLLPEDFGGFEGKYLVVTQADGQVNAKVPLIVDSYIDAQYATVNDATGRPEYVAERITLQPTRYSSNRHELYIYPEPDDVYIFRGRYSVGGRALTAANPYAYGGMEMASCFQAACRAVAEIHEDNLQPGQGAEWPIYQRALAAAIQRDGRHQAKTLGRNTDLSDPSRRFGGRGWWRDGTIQYVDTLTIDGEPTA